MGRKTSFAERFSRALQDRHISQRELARRTGATGATYSNWAKGAANPEHIGADLLHKTAKELWVTAAWLLTGEEPQHPMSPTGEAVEMANARAAAEDTRNVPVISWVQAGLANDVNDPYPRGQGEDVIGVDAETATQLSRVAFALRIEGDSMAPEFMPGDVVIIDPEVQPTPGDYVVAKIDDDKKATFKKYRNRGRSPSGAEIFELVPLNEDYAIVTVNELQPGRIIGTMVEHRRKRRRR